jgi:hypothetical protein
MKSAVLFLVFNRPETTKQVFEAIRLAKPARLYVAADGPRMSRKGEPGRCEEVRRIATNVDWPCELRTLFRDSNLGCKIGVSSGIDWFFDNEEEGIILEDDVLPVPSFFRYCDELLERYRHDGRVGMISGCNLITSRYTTNESYFFSRINHIWGWASWRRVWQHYDVEMSAWPDWRNENGLADFSDGNKCFESYWRDKFELTHSGHVDTWDYQWTFTCWRLGALTALPSRNQTRNIGFGADATHTVSEVPDYVLESVTQSLDFPLVHPSVFHRDKNADKFIDAEVFSINRVQMLRRWISRIPFLGALLRKCKAVLNYKAR